MKNFITDLLDNANKRMLILWTAITLMILSLVSIWPLNLVEAKVLPPKDGKTLSIYVNMPKGTTLQTTKENIQCIYQVLMPIPEILDVETFYGMGAPVDLVGLVKNSPLRSGEENAQLVLNLTKSHERSISSFVLAQNIRDRLKRECSNANNFLVADEPSGPPVIAGIVLEIYGKNQQKREEMAEKIANILQKTENLVDIDIQKEKPYHKFSIHIDKEKALRADLSVEHINKVIYLAFEGADVTTKNESDRNDPISLHVVLSDASKRLMNANKKDFEEKLSEVQLMNPQGVLINLNEVIFVIEQQTTLPIYAKNLEDYTVVSAETNLTSPIYSVFHIIQEITTTFSQQYEISYGNFFKREKGKYFDLMLTDKSNGQVYQLVWEGELQVTLDMGIDLVMVLGISILLIMTLLIFYYQNISYPILILLASFFGLIGVMVGHMIMNLFSEHQIYFTGTSIIGMIALIGISARNTILLIDQMKLMIKYGADNRVAIIASTITRAKPILLTAIGIMLGSSLLIPDSVFGGLGISLTFGIISATAASLILIPILLNLIKIESE